MTAFTQSSKWFCLEGRSDSERVGKGLLGPGNIAFRAGYMSVLFVKVLLATYTFNMCPCLFLDVYYSLIKSLKN